MTSSTVAYQSKIYFMFLYGIKSTKFNIDHWYSLVILNTEIVFIPNQNFGATGLVALSQNKNTLWSHVNRVFSNLVHNCILNQFRISALTSPTALSQTKNTFCSYINRFFNNIVHQHFRILVLTIPAAVFYNKILDVAMETAYLRYSSFVHYIPIQNPSVNHFGRGVQKQKSFIVLCEYSFK